MVVKLNPALGDNAHILNRHTNFADYAAEYGDQLAQWYEQDHLLYFPHFPIQCDIAYLQNISFPKHYKKVGTSNGIDKPLLVRTDNALAINKEHPLLKVPMGLEEAMYLQGEMANFNHQLRFALAKLFPRYVHLEEANITWRLTETQDEGMHCDIFGGGPKPYPEQARAKHRLKIFINIDSQPRQWRVGYSYAEVLRDFKNELPAVLPDDMNVLSCVIDKLGIMDRIPYHEVAFPQLSAVIGNGETLAHQVVYGRRTVGAEFFCPATEMVLPEFHSHTRLAKLYQQYGYEMSNDYEKIMAPYADRVGRLQQVILTQKALGMTSTQASPTDRFQAGEY